MISVQIYQSVFRYPILSTIVVNHCKIYLEDTLQLHEVTCLSPIAILMFVSIR